MTKKELSQLYYLNREILQDKQRLQELENRKNNPAANVVGLLRSLDGDGTAVAAEISDIKAAIKAKIQLSVVEYNRITRYVASVNDVLIRQIIMLRYINGLTWRDVAQHIGGGNTEKNVQMALNRYFEKQI